MSNPDGFLRVWRPMRPWLDCPHCGRRGAVQRRIGVKSFIRHRCPGPFVLDHVEKDSVFAGGGWRLIIQYKDYEPEGGDQHVCTVCRGPGRQGERLG